MQSCCCCSVAQSRPTLCDPMDYSTPGFCVLHHVLELAQTHVHWVGDAIQIISSSVILFSSCLQSFPASESFLLSWLYSAGGQSIGASSSALPMNIQDWFRLGFTGLISLQSKGVSSNFSSTIVQKHQFFGAQPSLSSTLTSIHDYWKTHGYDYMDLCRESNVSAF